MIDFSQILNIIKLSFKSELSPTAYNLWINPLKAVELRSSEAILSTENDFQRNIVSSKYGDRICKKLEEFLGFSIKLTILSEENLNKNETTNEDYDQHQNSNVYSKNSTNNKLDTYFNNSNPIDDSSDLNEFKQEKITNIKNIDERYTFQNFIVGNTNSFAYAACKAVAQNSTEAYNPLFIYGPSGLGKTHLLRAIENEVRRTKPNLNVLYIYGEAFTNEFISAIYSKTTQEFHEKYRNVDYLLMDDIQFLAGKTQTQEEFFYTFNELHKIGKQIVLTSDRPPKEIKTLEERLRTRFEWGLLADIAPSEFETRVAIIERKAEILEVNIPDEVIKYIAENLKNNVRQLEGAVKKIKAYKLLEHCPPSMTMAKSIIRDILNNDKPTPMTINEIVSEVSKTFNVSEKDITGNSRQAKIAKARHIAIFIVKEITKAPYEEIGKKFSNRNHSTIIHSLRQVKEILEKEPKQKEIVEDIIQNIRAR